MLRPLGLYLTAIVLFSVLAYPVASPAQTAWSENTAVRPIAESDDGGDPFATPKDDKTEGKNKKKRKTKKRKQAKKRKKAKKRKQAKGSKFGFRGTIEAEYSSNLYHTKPFRLVQHTTDTAVGERFFEMNGPADTGVSFGIGADVKWRLSKKRRLSLALDAQYALFAKNPVANTLSLDLSGKIDVGKRGRVSLDTGIIPHRFKKNYKTQEAGQRVFRAGRYAQMAAELGYRHRLTKRWSMTAEYGLRLRNFADPFRNRDQVLNSVAIKTSHRLGLFKLKAGGGINFNHTPGDEEFNLTVDRSYRGLEGDIEALVRLGSCCEAGLWAAIERRQFTTTVTTDTTNFERVDTRQSVGLVGEAQIGDALTLEFKGGWLKNNAASTKVTRTDEQVSFREITASVAVGFKI